MMMNPFSYLALRYKNCSIHVKLFASYFLLIFIPIIAHTMFATYQSTKIIEKQSMKSQGFTYSRRKMSLNLSLTALRPYPPPWRSFRMCMRCWKSKIATSASAKNTMT